MLHSDMSVLLGPGVRSCGLEQCFEEEREMLVR